MSTEYSDSSKPPVSSFSVFWTSLVIFWIFGSLFPSILSLDSIWALFERLYYGPGPRQIEIPNQGHPPAKPTYDPNIQYIVSVYSVPRYPSHLREFEFETHFTRRTVFHNKEVLVDTVPILQEVVDVIRRETERNKKNLKSKLKITSAGILINRDEEVGGRRLIINSPLLTNMLRAVIKYSSDAPSGDSDNFKAGRFEFPYRDLYLHLEEITAYKDSHPARQQHSADDNITCDTHIDLLLNYLYDQEEIGFKEAQRRWSSPHPTVTFSSCWLLLKPGSDVYVKEFGGLNAYVIESVAGGRDKDGGSRPYLVQLWNLSMVGTKVTRSMKSITVPIFDGEREIVSLPVFPTHFHQDQPGKQLLRDQLIERGKKFFTLVKNPAFGEYNGLGQREPIQNYSNTRVVIDCKRDQVNTLHQSASQTTPTSEKDEKPGNRARIPGCQCVECVEHRAKNEIYSVLPHDTYDDIDPKEVEHLDDHQYLICTSHIEAFILKDRIYDILDISLITEPNININAIDLLVMKTETNKNLLKAICNGYNSNQPHRPFHADFIQGKGEGQIILLHGPPGTGKTLTAESVAEYTRRPLLSITAADLGHDPVQLEKNLLTFFRDANRWGAIVLLDEADIYLERRSTEDLRRNSVVSIFLRAMDYFKGILFLTTNRVGSFDEAFMSRIHVQIGYDPLDDAAREVIWENYFRKLEIDRQNGGQEIVYEWEAKEFVKISREVRALNWNGREIRNAFQTAVSLALETAKEGKVPKLTEAHLRQVVRMSQSFRDYIQSTHSGKDYSVMAFDRGLRDDTKNG